MRTRNGAKRYARSCAELKCHGKRFAHSKSSSDRTHHCGHGQAVPKKTSHPPTSSARARFRAQRARCSGEHAVVD
jgi:hypothetical protein